MDEMADPPVPDLPPDPLIGQTVAGRYVVKRLIDRGGMGRVYEAEQQPLGRAVALKTLDLSDPTGEFQKRFFNEAQTASRLTHPNTVRIFDYGRSEDGRFFLTMELLEGDSLHAVIKRSAPLEPLRVIEIVRQVCGALNEAHERGIVHRDLKPGNIFLTRHGKDLEFAKVLDFGLVKDLKSDVELSQTGQMLGSPLYMSPEQVTGKDVDHRSDIYSLGLVMYVALCGRVPFERTSVSGIMMQQVTRQIPTFARITPDVRIPESLEWVVRRCIEKDPTKRLATMEELSVALKVCARELRDEVEGGIPWALDASGFLDIPAELIEGEDTSTGKERSKKKPAAPEPIGAPPVDLPSSPTLNRSGSAGFAAGAALAGGGMLLVGGGVVAVLLLVGLVAGVVFTRSAPEVEPAVVLDPVPIAAPVATVPEPVAETPSVVLESDPPGAEVSKDGAFVGVTPLDVELPDGSVRLTVHADGYEPREVLLDGTTERTVVPLKPVRRVARPDPKPVPAPEPDPAPVPSPGLELPKTDLRDPFAR
ncbi:MAG: serine/threonine protein kinase [Alphaproteobacteria bacterium]|nr:serine/threonine protein kinase [Alphaproteobacteria bacterium]